MPAVQEADNAGYHACEKCYVCKQNFLSLGPVLNLVVTILNKFSLLLSI